MGLGEVPLLNFLPVAPRLSGLMEVKETDNPGGQLVLAGDPRQLGPVLRSPLTQKHGLGYSLLERLLTYNALYKKGSNGYNPQFITKLLRNYRYPHPLTTPARLCLHLLCSPRPRLHPAVLLLRGCGMRGAHDLHSSPIAAARGLRPCKWLHSRAVCLSV